MNSIPDDWRSRMKPLPDRCGLTKVAEALGCQYEHIGQFRIKNKAFDDACFEKLAMSNRKRLYRGPVTVPTKGPVGDIHPVQEVLPNSIPQFEFNLNREDLLINLNRTVLRLAYYPSIQSADEHLTVPEKRYISALVTMSIDTIKDLLKQRRHLTSEVNQLRTRIHVLKRGGSLTIHASGNN